MTRRRSRGLLTGGPGRGGRAAWQVHRRAPGERAGAARPPADDRRLSVRAGHTRACVLELDDGTRIAYRDLRRFGTWLLLEPEEAEAHLARPPRTGAARPGFTADYLAQRLAGRKAPVKAAILDQTHGRRPREHLRGRGALARAASIRCGRRASSARTRSPRSGGHRKALRLGIRRQGADLGDGTYAGGRMQREFRSTAAWRAVRPLRHADREDPGRRARHLVLPGCQLRHPSNE
jgi:hypothetical protein